MEPRRHPAIGHPQRRAAKNIAVGDLVDIHCQGGRGWYLPVESITRRRRGILAIRVAPCPHWPRSANTIPARTLVLGPRQMVDTWEGRSLTREWIDNPHSPSIHRDSRGGGVVEAGKDQRMTAPAVLDASIEALDFQLGCDWGAVVQPYLTHCAEKPVWIVECPGCDNSWAMSCQVHYEFTGHAYGCYECTVCGKEWDPTELRWGKL